MQSDALKDWHQRYPGLTVKDIYTEARNVQLNKTVIVHLQHHSLLVKLAQAKLEEHRNVFICYNFLSPSHIHLSSTGHRCVGSTRLTVYLVP